MSPNATNTTAEQRLRDLGVDLSHPPRPLGAYVEAVQTGSLLFLSGTLPLEGGTPKFVGRVGGELSIEDGRSATHLAALNALAAGEGASGVARSSDPGGPSRSFPPHDSRVSSASKGCGCSLRAPGHCVRSRQDVDSDRLRRGELTGGGVRCRGTDS